MFKKILIGLLILFIIAQFFQPPHNNGEAEAATDITHVTPVPDSIMAILKIACYDCHSNQTRYPWYSKITPVNWWLNNHINAGKAGLNFTIFSTYSFKKKTHRMDDIVENVEKREMPLNSYLWIHKNAKLSDAQIKIISDWAKNARQKIMQDSLQTIH